MFDVFLIFVEDFSVSMKKYCAWPQLVLNLHVSLSTVTYENFPIYSYINWAGFIIEYFQTVYTLFYNNYKSITSEALLGFISNQYKVKINQENILF